MPADAADLVIEKLSGPALQQAIPDLARLRIEVFRDYPYLYDGSLDYERTYLEDFIQAQDAVIIAARSGDRIVGCATGSALEGHHDAFGQPLRAAGYDTSRIFYFGESVLDAAWRGRGIGHAFFDEREAWALSHGFGAAAFCAVIRPGDHPAKPADYSPLDTFWQKRGYRRLENLIAQFDWRDLGEAKETSKPMQVWYRDLMST